MARRDLVRMVAKFEGFEPEPYICIGGYLTIGCGAVLVYGKKFKTVPPAYANMRWTEEQALKALEKHITGDQLLIAKMIKTALEPHQFDAITSLVYNIGRWKFKKTRMLMQLNRGELHAMPKHFASFRRADGRIANGLVRRRCAEIRMWRGEPLSFEDDPALHYENL